MRPLIQFIKVLSDDEMERIYEEALGLLENPGMRFCSEKILSSLSKKGAKVDFATQKASIPRTMVEETLRLAVKDECFRKQSIDITEQERALTFSWHSSFDERVPEVKIAFGGGCPQYFDFFKDEIREATGDDLLRMVQLANAIPEVKAVGNPLHYILDSNGIRLDPRLLAIRGAALIAKNTPKPGLTTLLHPAELEFLIEMGIVIRGSLDEYKKYPLFININDTESPLQINSRESEIIAMLAEKELPVYILPAPMSGLTTPITLAANITIALAEIFGGWTAVKAVNSNAPVEAGIVSSSLELRSGSASFSSPEAILQDIAVAQIMRTHLGVKCGVHVGFIDASYPGPASTMERCFKIMAAAACGEINYPVGILQAGVVFSPEQAMIDIDISKMVYRFFTGINVDSNRLGINIIREKGPGAMFISEEHTLEYMREEIFVPGLVKRTKPLELKEERKRDIVIQAYEKWNEILKNSPEYHLPEYKEKEIDKIVACAERILASK